MTGSTTSPRRMRTVLLFAGAGLLAFLVRPVGPGTVATSFAELSWRLGALEQWRAHHPGDGSAL